jgi:hypothetical protein
MLKLLVRVLLAADAAAKLAVVGTLALAKEILDAGERVVANHARCLRLTARIHSIVPLLSCFHTHLERCGTRCPTPTCWCRCLPRLSVVLSVACCSYLDVSFCSFSVSYRLKRLTCKPCQKVASKEPFIWCSLAVYVSWIELHW